MEEVGQTSRRRGAKNPKNWIKLYRQCTILWRSYRVNHTRLCFIMKRSSLICVGSILILFWSSQAPAEDRITAFVNAHGKVVFTNTNLGRLRLSSSKINPELSKKIQQARLSKNMTQKQVANRLSIPVNEINEMECGKFIYNGQKISKVKRFLSIK